MRGTPVATKTPPVFDFDNKADADKTLKKVAQLMGRAGQPVVSFAFDPKTHRIQGVAQGYREALLTLASGQTVTLRIAESGMVYQVLVDSQLKPLKNQDDMIKAIGEIAALVDANQGKFQAALARKKVDMPKGIKTAAPRLEQVLTARNAELDAQIAEKQQQVEVLKAELGDAGQPEMQEFRPATALGFIDAFRRLASGNPLFVNIGQAPRGERLYDAVIVTDSGDYPLTTTIKRAMTSNEWRIADYMTDSPATDSHKAQRAFIDDVLAKINAMPDHGRTYDSATLDSANAIAQRILSGAVFDGVEHAAATLRIALDAVETNRPINLAAGNTEQTDLEARCAESYRQALAILDSADEEEGDPGEDESDDQSSLFDEADEEDPPADNPDQESLLV